MAKIYKTKKEAVAACKAGGYVGKTRNPLPEKEEHGFFCVQRNEVEHEWITEEECRAKGGSVADAVACASGDIEGAAKACILPLHEKAWQDEEEKGLRAVFIRGK